MRAGVHALTLLSVPLNANVMMALDKGGKSLVDLRRSVGSPPQTTMRGHLRSLTEMGVLERRRRDDFPGSVEYELLRPGRELAEVASVLERWLSEAPNGPVVLGETAAKSAVKAFTDGWSAGIVRVLAAHPLSLTELSRLISDLSYPTLERRLGAMRLAGLITARQSNGRGTPYVVSRWLRSAVAPFFAAASWERRHLPTQSAAIGRIDIEAAFLLAAPILRLPADLSGTCRLAVQLRPEAGGRGLAGVRVAVDGGRVVSCVSRLEGEASAWVSGPTSLWLRALADHETEGLEIGGDCELALTILDEFHAVLFRARQKA